MGLRCTEEIPDSVPMEMTHRTVEDKMYTRKRSVKF
ncbi:rCG29253 [Rattus norvegicus]|uniref:RCG29253 n=1 Tax=Rattus norvegicus TaxID=10116 RepID=A6K967_RAT|nr:rCG29253 [Rattus norvegicus]